MWEVNTDYRANLQHEDPIYLLIQALTNDSQKQLRSVGYIVFNVAPQFKTRYGSYELELLKPPIKLQDHDQDFVSEIGSIKFSVLRPMEQFD